MHQIFIGYDHRQPISYNVLQHSIIARATKPVTIAPLNIKTLPIERTGLTPFTFTRYLVPWLMDFKGWALFMDSDVLVLGDVIELMDIQSITDLNKYAVMVSKNPRKFEWPSVMLWNCGHPANKTLTPEYIADETVNPFKWGWLEGFAIDQGGLIGDLPREWNHLIGYDQPNDKAKLIHYTSGVPAWPETQMHRYDDTWKAAHAVDTENSRLWEQELQMVHAALAWPQLMGQSVHATHMPDGAVLPHFHPDVTKMRTVG